MKSSLVALLFLGVVFGAEADGIPSTNFLPIVQRYADTMLARGRDVYGPQKTGLLLSALDRTTLAPLKVRPAPPAGIRRGDRPGRAWVEMNGANPMLDENLLRVLYALTELTGDTRYATAADEELSWFFNNTMSPRTSLLPWGEHLCWDVVLDVPISGGDENMHEFARPWLLWDRCFALVPEPSQKFALGLWEHQIANHQTGGFDRHAPYFEHGPADGKDFPRHAGFYIATWACAWKHTTNAVFLQAIETLLGRFERKRVQKDGSIITTIGPIDCASAAALVPAALAGRLRAFAAQEDELLLPELRRQLKAHAEVAKASGFSATSALWRSAYGTSTLANQAMLCLARYEQSTNANYRDLVVALADAYLSTRPPEDVDAWPMTFAHAISAEVASWRFTQRPVYLEQARRFGQVAVNIFWQDNALPRASMKTGHYETITGADSLALALLELHCAVSGLTHRIPSNTIDR